MDRPKVITGSIAVEKHEKVAEMRVNHGNRESHGFLDFVLHRILEVLFLHRGLESGGLWRCVLLIERKSSDNLLQIPGNIVLAGNGGIFSGLLSTYLHNPKGSEKRLEYQVHVHSPDNLLSICYQPARVLDIHANLQSEDRRNRHPDVLFG